MEISQSKIKELFDYNEINGSFIRKTNPGTIPIKGCIAGHLNKSTGYIIVSIDRKRYRLHRLIYMYHHGYMPKYIDHADGNRTNNLISNLRECTILQNNTNRKKAKNSACAYLGVFTNHGSPGFRAQIRVDRKSIHIGRYNTENEAALAYNEAALKYHGEFARLNNVQLK